jgi:hypothetical protein
MSIGKILITAGVALIVAGLLFTLLGRLGLGRLPGDFVWRRGNTTIHFPLMTSILVSVALSALLWLASRR